MEELLKQILEENKKMNKSIEGLTVSVEGLTVSVESLTNEVITIKKDIGSMKKDIKSIRDYQLKGQDVDIERLQNRVTRIEEHLKIS